MTLFRIINRILRGQKRAFGYGLALSIVVLGMGVGLLALSGWFITASAAAGMAGIGILFNVFAPSAMVRFLALGRTAARYGERVLTHDATLRAVSDIRVQLLKGVLRRPYRALETLRAPAFLNRVTADTDALDGVLLRLVFPALAGGVTVFLSAVFIAILVHPVIGFALGSGFILLPLLIFFIGRSVARRPSRLAENALQTARSRFVDLILGRDDLTVYGRLGAARGGVDAAFARHAMHRARLDAIERGVGAMLEMLTGGMAAAMLGLGIWYVQQGEIPPARAAIAIFAALALGEALAPLRRAIADMGRIGQAARNIAPDLAEDPRGCDRAPILSEEAGLRLAMRGVTYHREGAAAPLFSPLDFDLRAGETVVLRGPSGCGKSTVLLLAAGALRPTSGTVRLLDAPVSELLIETITQHLALVPQRAALVMGTVGENLRLAAPEVGDVRLWEVLDALCLGDVLRAKDGLNTRLGSAGAGLSGGEARRLVLARAALRAPSVLLLDEPTEGLDEATARAVMAGVRALCPEAAMVIAAHRHAEIAAGDHVIDLVPATPDHT